MGAGIPAPMLNSWRTSSYSPTAVNIRKLMRLFTNPNPNMIFAWTPPSSLADLTRRLQVRMGPADAGSFSFPNEPSDPIGYSAAGERQTQNVVSNLVYYIAEGTSPLSHK